MSEPRGARAPGKLLLTGEYAVLFGAPALVTAVDRYAEARLTEDASERPRAPEPALALARLEAERGPLGRGMTTDVTALRAGGMKLGLGSSAAATVAAAAAALYAYGARPTPGELFDLADSAHRAIQPGGSGVDVAASAHGGTLCFSRDPGPRVEPVTLPPGLAVRVVFTGREASTQAMLGAMRRFEAEHPAAFEAAMDQLRDEARRAAGAVTAGAAAFVEGAGAYGEALGDFGARVGVPIVDEASLAVDALARRHGGRAKPSGAGGGDVAVAFFTGGADAARFDEAARAERLETLSLRIGAEGPGPLPPR